MDELQRYGLLSIACLIVLCLALTFKDREHANTANARTDKPVIIQPEKPSGDSDANIIGGSDELAKAGKPGDGASDPKSQAGRKDDSKSDGKKGEGLATADPPKTDAVKPDTQPSTYQVAAGDTFRKIAKAKLGDENRWPEIVAANPGLKATSLKVGKSLKIPAKSKAAPHSEEVVDDVHEALDDPKKSVDGKSATPGLGDVPSGKQPKKDAGLAAATKPEKKSMVAPANAKARVSPRTHTVGRGESLASIGRKYYDDAMSWKKIYNANKTHMKSATDIHEGLVLTLP